MKNKRLNQRLTEKNEKILWLSFCDPDRQPGSQFLGVVVTRAEGILSAVQKLWCLGINPGGEVQCVEIDEGDINPEHFDKLLSKDDMIKAGYIEANAEVSVEGTASAGLPG